jgi:hypothetical protein
MKSKWLACSMGAALLAAGVVSGAATGAVDQAGKADVQTWSAWGGDVGIRWNRDLAADLGIHIAPAVDRLAHRDWRGRELFVVRRAGSLDFRVENGHFRGFDGGYLQAQGGYRLHLADGDIDLTNFRMRPRAGHPSDLDLVASDGKVWFYLDHLMYELIDSGRRFAVREIDLRIAPELAARLHQPVAANLAIADMELTSDLLQRGTISTPAGSCNTDNGDNCNWTGTAAPNDGTYEADLFMSSFTPQYSRCRGPCTGPGGSGEVVFTPSSSLKNNVNAGSIEVTVPGQGDLGTSTALWAADIPWFTMFTGPNQPYGNDQHPFLIWNMYRVDADGLIEQIGRSGVKHAFVTVNGGSECPYPFSHVLGRGCEDTYATGNNDSSSDLGPRSEIIPGTNQWGRCGSIYDPDCTGSYHDPGNDNYDQRLIVSESQLDASANPGATWMFESWYLAREDINIYNSMGTLDTVQHWTGSIWGINSSNYTLGPAIDRWVDPVNPGVNAMNSELVAPAGHAKLAVKVTDLGSGQWRYDYAAMNFDYSNAKTEGAEPNLHVIANRGFDSFGVRIPQGADVNVIATRFLDGDLDATNDWPVSTDNGRVVWTAPQGESLDWGTLYSFSLTVNAPPVAGDGRLHPADAGEATHFDVATLVPQPVDPADIVFSSGFDAPN